MATAFKQVADNATSTTTTGLTAVGVTTVTTASAGEGDKFPTPGNGFYLTLWNGRTPGGDTNMERVFVSGRIGDTMTISPTTKTHTSPCNIGLLDGSSTIVELQAAVNALESGGGGALTPTGVTPGSYVNSNLTVNAEGRITIASNGTGGVGSNAYDITNFGAKVDGKIYNTFVTTSGSPSVTLSGGALSSSDIGKTIILHRSGSSSSELVTTITGVASSTSCTVAIAPSVTASGVMGGYGTDDTAAYQAAINAINTNVNGGNAIITVPAGISMIAGPQVSGTSGGGAYSGQILFPSRDHSLPIHSFVIRGASSQSGPDTSGPQAAAQQYPPNNGTILLSTATSGSVFSCIPATTGSLSGRFTFINAVFENLILRCLPATNANGLMLEGANSAQVRNVIVDIFCGVTDTLAWGSSNTGIFMPQVDNSANCLVENSWVNGFYCGLRHAECTHLNNVSIYLCYIAIGVQRGYHDATYDRVTLSQNVIMVQANSNIGVGSSIPATTIRGTVDLEHAATGKPYTNIYDFDDSGNKLRGYLRIHLVQGGVGLAHDIRLNGATFLHVVEDQASIGAGELLAQKVYNPATAAIIAATSTLTAVDTTNASFSFIPPPSRAVLIEVSAVVSVASTSAQLNIGMLEGATPVGSQAEMRSVTSGTGASSDLRVLGQVYVSSLAQVQHTYSLAIVGSGTANLVYGGPSSISGYGPLVIKVIASA